MRLSQLLSDVPVLAAEGSMEREITALHCDSRRVLPGSLFVALSGRKHDGHQFIPEAVQRGAVAVLCERKGYYGARVAQIHVEDGRASLARMAARFYGFPSRALKVIGITGTTGKTTVAFLVKHILQSAGVRTGLISTIQYEAGGRVLPAHRTTPESVEVQQMLAQMVRAECAACVLEISGQALEQRRVDQTTFAAGIFTNFAGEERERAAEFALTRRWFAEVSDAASGTALINIDDAGGSWLAERPEVRVAMTYGLGERALIRGRDLERVKGSTRLCIETPGGSFVTISPLKGRHNVSHLLAAVGAGLAMNIPLDQIRDSLTTPVAVPGRMEEVDLGQPFSVFVDYAHTETALRRVLQAARELSTGRVLVAFGCGGGTRAVDLRRRMGRAAAEEADLTLVTSDNPRDESPAVVAAGIEQGYRDVREDGLLMELERRSAIEEILRAARPGDVVVIAGKGHETYQEFEHTVIPFDDRIHVRQALEQLGYSREERTPKQEIRAGIDRVHRERAAAVTHVVAAV